MELPDRISTAIAQKRNSSNAGEEPKTPEAPKPVETPVEEKPEEKKVTTPEPKKDEAPKPKPGQSIAQIAADTTIGDDEDDDDDDDDDTPKGDKKSHGRGSIFSEFKTMRKELKSVRRDNESMSELIAEIPKLVSKIEELMEGKKPSDVRDELDEFAKENGLDPAGLKQLAGILEKKLSGKLKPKDKDEEPAKKTESQKKTVDAEMQLRKVELAIENEYDDYIDSFPQAKGKLNLKAIKQYILSDKENLTKSFSDIVDTIYPGLLTNKAGTDGGSSNQVTIEDDEKVDWKDPAVQERMKKDEKLRNRYKTEFKEKAKAIFKS